MVVAFNSASWLSRQLSFAAIVPDASCNSRVGSARFSLTGRKGPSARIRIFFGCEPVTVNPAIKTLSPDPTASRVEMFARRIAGIASVLDGVPDRSLRIFGSIAGAVSSDDFAGSAAPAGAATIAESKTAANLDLQTMAATFTTGVL